MCSFFDPVTNSIRLADFCTTEMLTESEPWVLVITSEAAFTQGSTLRKFRDYEYLLERLSENPAYFEADLLLDKATGGL